MVINGLFWKINRFLPQLVIQHYSVHQDLYLILQQTSVVSKLNKHLQKNKILFENILKLDTDPDGHCSVGSPTVAETESNIEGYNEEAYIVNKTY
jgi:hypothetical protein